MSVTNTLKVFEHKSHLREMMAIQVQVQFVAFFQSVLVQHTQQSIISISIMAV